jgi:DNA-binding transcriptional regulator YiaG
MHPGVDVKSARRRLGLSQTGLAEALRLGPNGERTIRRWEAGDVPVTGPASVAIELLLARPRSSLIVKPRQELADRLVPKD